MKSFVVGSVLLLASACSGYVPADTPEVAAAKAAHFAAHAKVGGYGAGHGYGAPAGHWDGHGHHEGQKWHGPLHFPVISKGVPVETPEVQHAKAAHAAAYAKVAAYAPAHGHYDHGAGHAGAGHGGAAHGYGAWHGPQHVPVIHNGVPVDTPEVQHAKAAHLHALAAAGTHSGHSVHSGHHWGGAGHEDDGSYKPEYDHHHY